MKIVAGMSRVDDYESYIGAGADELFIGYVSPEWQLRYGLYTPLNRREVCYYHVQIGSESELRILADKAHKYDVPVTVAFNGLHYRPDQYKDVMRSVIRCRELGFSSVIVADPALLLFLHEAGLTESLEIHISGEFGEMNRFVVRELSDLGAKRLIFHRKVPIADMRNIIEDNSELHEFEAFLLNEMCHFHGGYCASLHCDELVPMCRMPYIITGEDIPTPDEIEADPDSLGAGGCGLCALWKLREAGVTHLKIVGRGAHSDNMIRDIHAVKSALEILSISDDEKDYIRRIKTELFPTGCAKKCYYPEDL